MTLSKNMKRILRNGEDEYPISDMPTAKALERRGLCRWREVHWHTGFYPRTIFVEITEAGQSVPEEALRA